MIVTKVKTMNSLLRMRWIILRGGDPDLIKIQNGGGHLSFAKTWK